MRIDYIDLAKGFCIILVVFVHIVGYFHLHYALSNALGIFRMPLYFFLSGLFFKTYEGFGGFIKRKINKLLIPFLFFYLCTSVLLPVGLHFVGYEVRNSNVVGVESLYAFIYPPHHCFPNYPIWFLICLFVDNIMFYAIYTISGKAGRYRVFSLLLLITAMGMSGYYLSLYSIGLPMYIDTAMSALPFFGCGYICNKYTNFLQPNKFDKWLIWMAILCFVYLFLFAGSVSYADNSFRCSAWIVYSCGLIGTFFVLMLSKAIKRLPVVSYCGRYSIIILLTHNLVIQALLVVVRRIPCSDWWQVCITLIVTVLLYLIIIPLFLRYLPYVTAQKDVILIKK